MVVISLPSESAHERIHCFCSVFVLIMLAYLFLWDILIKFLVPYFHSHLLILRGNKTTWTEIVAKEEFTTIFSLDLSSLGRRWKQPTFSNQQFY